MKALTRLFLPAITIFITVFAVIGVTYAWMRMEFPLSLVEDGSKYIITGQDAYGNDIYELCYEFAELSGNVNKIGFEVKAGTLTGGGIFEHTFEIENLSTKAGVHPVAYATYTWDADGDQIAIPKDAVTIKLSDAETGWTWKECKDGSWEGFNEDKHDILERGSCTWVKLQIKTEPLAEYAETEFIANLERIKLNVDFIAEFEGELVWENYKEKWRDK